MKEIEYSIIRGLLKNEAYFNGCFHHIKPEYFDSFECKRLFNIIGEFYNDYDKRPSLDSIRIIIKDGNAFNQVEYDALLELYSKLVTDNTTKVDYDFLLKETESYCKKQALVQAIFFSAKLLDEKPDEVSIISEVVQEALSVSFDNSVGMDFILDMKERFAEYRNKASKIPFNFPELDMYTAGGLSRKELVSYLAPTNTGKTRLMCFNAACFLMGGYNVLYFTLEMEEGKITRRVDANLMNVDSEELSSVTDEMVEEYSQSIQAKTNGHLVVKQLPSGASAAHMRHVVKELFRKRGIKPDVIIVDYIDLCGSSKHPKAEGNEKGKYVAEEIRNLGLEFNAGVLTATQTNRSGAKVSDFDETSIADSFAKVMTFDALISLFSDKEMASRGEQVFNLLKSRDVDKSAFDAVVVGVDNNKSRFLSRMEGAPSQEKIAIAHKMDNMAQRSVDKLKKKRENTTVDWG